MAWKFKNISSVVMTYVLNVSGRVECILLYISMVTNHRLLRIMIELLARVHKAFQDKDQDQA